VEIEMAKTKLYLARFTFRSGEAELPFEHTVLGLSLVDVEKKVRNYLRTFAGEPRRIGTFSYEYYGGYYAVSYSGSEPATPKSVVRNLLISA
jgi:hypothetical protein